MRQVIQDYLGIYRKTLDASLVEEILAAPQAANPLYLRCLLDELRVFGIFEKRGEYLRHYLTAPNPPSLFGLILVRLERDYDKPRPGLVKDALSCLWAARRGLMESELLELLGQDDQPLPRALWSPLALALEDSLVSRSGLLTFFHDYLRQAVQERYLPTPETEQDFHLRLGSYFETRELDDRKVDELPWQLHRAQAWELLRDVLTNLDIFLKLRTDAKQYELLGYWLALKEYGYHIASAYEQALQEFQAGIPSEEDLALRIHEVAFFLSHCDAEYEIAIHLCRKALLLREQLLGSDHPDVARTQNNLATIYFSQGRYTKAEPLFRSSLTLLENSLGPKHPIVAKILNNLATLYTRQGKYREAESLYQRDLAIKEKILKEKGPGPECQGMPTSLNNLASLYEAQGRDQEAEVLFQQALDLSEKIYGPEHPIVAIILNNLAELYREQVRDSEADPLYRRSISICEKLMGPEHPITATSLNNLAVVYQDQGRYEEAKPLYQRALAIRQNVLGPTHIETNLIIFNLAELSLVMGADFGELYRQFLTTIDKVLDKERIMDHRILKRIAIAHNEIAFHSEVPAQNWQEAEHHYFQALDIFERIGRNKEAANVELNLQVMFNLSGQSVDIARVRELIHSLEEADDPRAQKGQELLAQLEKKE
jgi:tetratricopeptide (TPR) repeat protein